MGHVRDETFQTINYTGKYIKINPKTYKSSNMIKEVYTLINVWSKSSQKM